MTSAKFSYFFIPFLPPCPLVIVKSLKPPFLSSPLQCRSADAILVSPLILEWKMNNHLWMNSSAFASRGQKHSNTQALKQSYYDNKTLEQFLYHCSLIFDTLYFRGKKQAPKYTTISGKSRRSEKGEGQEVRCVVPPSFCRNFGCSCVTLDSQESWTCRCTTGTSAWRAIHHFRRISLRLHLLEMEKYILAKQIGKNCHAKAYSIKPMYCNQCLEGICPTLARKKTSPCTAISV